MNILGKCVKQLALLLFPSDADCLVTGLVKQAASYSGLKTEIFKGMAVTKCGSVEKRILPGTL